jgi:predicted NUDIX family NTP pyrophosphohydrolase
MPRSSAGLLLFRFDDGAFEVLIVHPGGPLWTRKDEGAWSIPKGEYGEGEDPAVAAAREFREELGLDPPPGPWLDLGEIRQAGGKRVRAWALRASVDVSEVVSNTFEMEWPPHSGQLQSFPEIDRAAWVSLEEARDKLNPAQRQLLDLLPGVDGTGAP